MMVWDVEYIVNLFGYLIIVVFVLSGFIVGEVGVWVGWKVGVDYVLVVIVYVVDLVGLIVFDN